MKKCWPAAVIALLLAMSLSSCNRNSEYEEMAEAAKRGENSYRKYKTADYPTAKAALLDFIRFLDEKTRDPEYPEPGAANADIMLSYVRLAKLEEKFSRSEKENYMQQALAKCQQLVTPKRDCTAEGLRELVDKGDAIVEPK